MNFKIMKLIQIQATPLDWDLSILRAVGVDRNGRKLSPIITALTAKALPEPHLSVWRAAVEQFRALGNGEWDAATVKVYKETVPYHAPRPAWMEQDEVPSDVQPEPTLICDITANYPDGTIDCMTLNLTAPEMIAFFDYFTDEVNWPNPQSTMQP